MPSRHACTASIFSGVKSMMDGVRFCACHRTPWTFARRSWVQRRRGPAWGENGFLKPALRILAHLTSGPLYLLGLYLVRDMLVVATIPIGLIASTAGQVRELLD